MNKLAGKIAIVTGGNSGIGFATARHFVAEGAKVLVVGRRSEAVDQAVAELGSHSIGVVGDVAECCFGFATSTSPNSAADMGCWPATNSRSTTTLWCQFATLSTRAPSSARALTG